MLQQYIYTSYIFLSFIYLFFFIAFPFLIYTSFQDIRGMAPLRTVHGPLVGHGPQVENHWATPSEYVAQF